MSNPFKYSNYTEHNSALVPGKLINQNLVIPGPVFDEDSGEDDEEGRQKEKK